MKFELRQMRRQDSGAIVNCSSLGGLVGGPRRGIYHAAKHGVLGLTKKPAREAAVPLRLQSVERRAGDTLWIRYTVARS